MFQLWPTKRLRIFDIRQRFICERLQSRFIGAKAGPLAPGAAITHFPPYRLWAHEINEQGGLGQRKIELIEYDDRTQPPEAIKAVERAATVDKCDWIGGNYATGFNLACAAAEQRVWPGLSEASLIPA